MKPLHIALGLLAFGLFFLYIGFCGHAGINGLFMAFGGTFSGLGGGLAIISLIREWREKKMNKKIAKRFVTL